MDDLFFRINQLEIENMSLKVNQKHLDIQLEAKEKSKNFKKSQIHRR
jgi:hypothetical protein